MSGINTNLGAHIALQNLGAASTQVEKTQKTSGEQLAGAPSFADELKGANANSVAGASPPATPTPATTGSIPSQDTQGLTTLINSNLETEAAKLQALQVQQQLGSQTVGIVNQRASTILSLFK
jgi:flagellin